MKTCSIFQQKCAVLVSLEVKSAKSALTIVVFSGIEILLTEPFDVKPNTLNKHGVSALWLAARYNYLDIGMALLQFNPNPEFQADPNVQV
jgi:hypothetical protein